MVYNEYDHELIGHLELHPFEVQIEDDIGYFEIDEGGISIHCAMRFY